MADRSRHIDQDLWLITGYFNPLHFRRRILNYRLFRQHMPLPLLAVEMSCDGNFDLGPDDADILVSVPGKDLMWQRERLLNVAVRSLPESCTKLIWMDCDTIFGQQDWPERVSRALDNTPVVQPFNRVYHLVRDAHLQDPRDRAAAGFVQLSIPETVASGRPARDCLSGIRNGLAQSFVMGMGWALRREVLDDVGFYDPCIVGGGSRAQVAAAYGCFEEMVRLSLMNAHQRDHFLIWAARFHDKVRGDVGWVEADLFHLWHGNLSDRRYKERHEGLQPHGFDPVHDLAIDPSGAWRWNSDKPALHQYVRDYFAARKDDG